jgi:hypothetical protein
MFSPDLDMLPMGWIAHVGTGTVRFFNRMFALEDAIVLHAFAPLETLTCV